jgi:hypothetical protein
MADIPISWKKITRGLPKGKKYTDDRIPTIEEIQEITQILRILYIEHYIGVTV